MSDSDSAPGAEFGQTAGANASVARAELAALNAQHPHVERIVDEENWHDTNGPGFRRFLAEQHRLRDTADRLQRLSKRPGSETSSMAVSVGTMPSAFGSSASVGYPPSLVSNSTDYSSPSLRTSQADSFLELAVLQEGSEGAFRLPTAQREGRLACSFSFLACTFRSDDLTEWDTHCQSHLHGHLPLSLHCPFVCDWSRTANSGQEAWQARQIHMWSAHQRDGHVDTDRRPESSLVQHLWRARIIDDAELKELRKNGRLTDSQIFLRSAGRERDRRTVRRQPAPGRR